MNSSGLHQDHNLEDIEAGVVALFSKLSNLNTSISSLGDLSDGVALSELLARIPGGHFKTTQLVSDTEGNWALAHKNMTQLMDSIEKYYQVVLKVTEFEKESVLDVMEISKHAKKEEIVKLVELVLGVMVQSEQKSEFIQTITQLDKNHQAILMYLMEKWIVNERLSTQEDQEGNENNSSIRGSMTMINNGIQAYFMEQHQLVLKKMDEMEKENEHLIEKDTEMKHELKERDRKLALVENELAEKEEEIKKLKLSRDGLLLSLGMSNNDDVETIVKVKDSQIDKLNELIVGIRKQNAEENQKIHAENEQLDKKCKLLQKSNEQIEFYKAKCQESNTLTEKISEIEKSKKVLDKVLQDKDSSIEMLKEKLQEFKQTFSEERKKLVEKDILCSEQQSQIEELKKQKDIFEHQLQIQEEKHRDISATLERLHFNQEQRNSSLIPHSQKQNGVAPKGLNEDLSQIIDDLERENNILKSEQTSTVDISSYSLEDVSHFKEQITIIRKNLEESIKEKAQLQSKLDSLQECNIEKLKLENEKLKGDYQTLLIQSVKAKESEREAMLTEQNKKLKEEIASKEILEKRAEELSNSKEILEKRAEELQISKEILEKRAVELSTSKEVLEKRVAELLEKINEQQAIIVEKQDKLADLNANSKTLLESKSQEVQLITEVLSEMRKLYLSEIQRVKSGFQA